MQKHRAKLIREAVCSNAWWSVGLGAFFPLGHGFDYKSFVLWLILVLRFGENSSRCKITAGRGSKWQISTEKTG